MLGLAVAGLVVGLSTVVLAHLKVEKTLPETDSVVTQAPGEIRVWFSQAPSLPVSALALEGPSGRIELGKVVAGTQPDQPDKTDQSITAPVKGPMAPGKYTASWKTSGADGHILTGTFAFTYTPER